MDNPHVQKIVAPERRALIDTIIITPAKTEKGIDTEIVGRLANMLTMASGQPMNAVATTGTPTVERVAGIGFQRTLIVASA